MFTRRSAIESPDMFGFQCACDERVSRNGLNESLCSCCYNNVITVTCTVAVNELWFFVLKSSVSFRE